MVPNYTRSQYSSHFLRRGRRPQRDISNLMRTLWGGGLKAGLFYNHSSLHAPEDLASSIAPGPALPLIPTLNLSPTSFMGTQLINLGNTCNGAKNLPYIFPLFCISIHVHIFLSCALLHPIGRFSRRVVALVGRLLGYTAVSLVCLKSAYF